MKIGICGGGVGGLSSAIGLLSLGHEVEVFERASDVRATGAGFNIWPNAARAIYGLGLREQYDSIAVNLERYLEFDPAGEALCATETGHWAKKYGAAASGVYRPELADIMADAVGLDRIWFNHEVVNVEKAHDKAVCHFSNGNTFEGDVIIGSDGIHSNLREQLVGAMELRPNPLYGYRFRSIINMSDADVDPLAQTGYFAPGGWIAYLPIGNGKGYWFGSVSGAETYDDFKRFFSDWKNTPVPDTLENTPLNTMIQSPLNVVVPEPYDWVHGRVALIGDAAHPIMPDMAQGAGQTFIDAFALKQAFANHSDADHALREFELKRKPVAAKIVEISAQGLFLGSKGVPPIAIRYEDEVEPISD